jgi:hypothetical protein
MTAHIPRGQLVLACERCGNPTGGRHAIGCTPALRLEYQMLQMRGASASGKADEIYELTATITAISLQIAELGTLRDKLSQDVWGCTYAEAVS